MSLQTLSYTYLYSSTVILFFQFKEGSSCATTGTQVCIILPVLIITRVWTGDEVACRACSHQQSYDTVIDNYCTADFGQLNIQYFTAVFSWMNC